jgi:hypothetical protein
MKPGDTRWHAQDIAAQPALRNMQAMHTNASKLSATKAMPMRIHFVHAVLTALVAGIGAAHAADAQEATAERPLDLSLPRNAMAETGSLKAPADGRGVTKPYGSGYEVRRLNMARDSAAAVAGSASGAASGARAFDLGAAAARPGAGAGSGGNRSGAGRRGRR